MVWPRRAACLAACLFCIGLASVLSGCGLVFDDDPTLGRQTIVSHLGGTIGLNSEEAGAGDTVLMIHGLGASAYSWRHLRALLSDGQRVIALDLKGFGRSDKPLDEAYSAIDQAKLVRAFIEQRNLRDITLIGHSFGGGVALAVALELNTINPGRIRRLVLIDAVAYEQGLPPALYVLKIPILGPLASAAILPELKAAASLVFAYKDPTKIDPEAIEAYARPMYDAGNQNALVQTARKIIPEQVATLTSRYKTVHQPVQLIWCRDDKIVPLAIGQRLVRELPNARLDIIETCGHIPQEEAPAQTANLINRFLKR